MVFWPDLAKETHLTITLSFGAADDKAHRVTACVRPESGCIVTTSSGQLFQIGTRNAYGRPNLSYRHMAAGNSLLQWGMRSLFGFGSSSQSDTRAPRTMVCPCAYPHADNLDPCMHADDSMRACVCVSCVYACVFVCVCV